MLPPLALLLLLVTFAAQGALGQIAVDPYFSRQPGLNIVTPWPRGWPRPGLGPGWPPRRQFPGRPGGRPPGGRWGPGAMGPTWPFPG